MRSRSNSVSSIATRSSSSARPSSPLDFCCAGTPDFPNEQLPAGVWKVPALPPVPALVLTRPRKKSQSFKSPPPSPTKPLDNSDVSTPRAHRPRPILKRVETDPYPPVPMPSPPVAALRPPYGRSTSLSGITTGMHSLALDRTPRARPLAAQTNTSASSSTPLPSPTASHFAPLRPTTARVFKTGYFDVVDNSETV